jgi:2-polyprenyl-3-methyl-5-hydroxy-6-metoxy-1,4-benzoquinol methylase
MSEALATLQQVAADTEQGYVELQTIPYRAHHLLAEEVLSLTRPGDRVFEGGVSSGYFARVLTAAGRRVDGHELDPQVAAAARTVCDRVYVGDLQDFDVEEIEATYDVLLFGDTLEHLPDPAAVLRRLRTKLRPDGHLVVSVPNIANWSVRLQLLGGRFRYTDRGILDRTHLRFFTVKTLPEMLAAGGFRVERLIASVPVPGVRTERLGRLTHRVGNLRPGFFGYNLIAVAAPDDSV